MTLPTSGSITMQQIATELNLSLPLDLNDSRVRALAGKPTGNVTMPGDFYGKSSGPTVTIAITTSGSEAAGVGRRRDYFVVTVNWTGSVTPSSYSWSWGGYTAILSTPSGRSCRFSGQGYNTQMNNGYDTAEPFCTVVISGVSYSVGGPMISLTTDGNL